MRTSVWLVRHGQTVYNLERRYQSWSDTPLTDYGMRQARLLARRLQRLPFDMVLVSPVERSRATARLLLAERSAVPVVEAAAWAETNHGRWEGLTYKEVLARFPGEAQARWAEGIHGRAGGGESLAEVAQRVAGAWHDLQERYPAGRVLVVTHATPIQLVIAQSFGLPLQNHWQWRIDPGSVSCFDIYPSGVIVRMINEVPRGPT